LVSASHLIAEEKEPLTSTFDENWLKAVVSIEVMTNPTNSSPIGTGFLLTTQCNHIILVTAKHVVENREGTIRTDLAYRINRKNATSYLLGDTGVVPSLGNWLVSTNADVALRFISWEDRSDFAPMPMYVMLPQKSIQAGAPLVILGFPMGLRSEEHSVAVLRKGVIARSDPGNLLADCFVFPGNSGGPVIYLPNVRFGQGWTNPMHNEQKLLGLVTSDISYSETAVSMQTLKPRITFEENSGLCIVVPTDRITELTNSSDFKRIDSQTHP
jgi:hypothetical protein